LLSKATLNERLPYSQNEYVARTPSQLRDDLTGLLQGEVLWHDTDRMLYATDASIYRILPAGVVVPRNEADLQRLVRYAQEEKVSLTPRGGGTGLSGESLTSGVVVDLSRHFQRIISLQNDSVTFQCGVTAQHLNDRLRPLGRRVPVEIDSHVSCTIGGMIATNASGARILTEGYLRQYVQSLQVVLATGEIGQFHATCMPSTSSLTQHSGDPESSLEQVLSQKLAQIVSKNRSLIAECQPRTPFNRCGYLLHDLQRGQEIDTHKIFVGAEGTLGFVTQATLRTTPLSPHRAALLLAFASLPEAAALVVPLLASQPAIFELLDRRVLTVASEADPAFKRQLHPQVQAALLLEWENQSSQAVMERVQAALHSIHRSPHLLSESLALQDEAVGLRQAVSRSLPAINTPKTHAAPFPVLEDLGVPVAELADFLDNIQKLLRRHGLSASIISHAGAGIVHLRPLFNLQEPNGRESLRAFTEDVYNEVFKRGGTISAQHGVGLARTAWMARQSGPLLNVWREIKQLFDPQQLLNPGKLISGTQFPLDHLRVRANSTENSPKSADDLEQPRSSKTAAIPLSTVEWRLNWPQENPHRAAGSCNGCGACRTVSPSHRMCPIFRAQGSEEASPRAKANLMRELLQEADPIARWASPEAKKIAQLCVNCKMCAVECPSHVDIPKLMLELRAQNVAESGLSWQDWLLARIDSWARWGSALSWFVNPLLRSEPLRWLLEKSWGLSRRRRLPAFVEDTFLKRARRYGWSRPTQIKDRPRVVYFADTYANYLDPDLAEASVRVLQAAGVEVYVPPERLVSGAAALAVGHAARAKRIAKRNLHILAELTRQGYSILCSEPTAVVMLRQDYPHLLNDPATEHVARNTFELMWYLREFQEQGRLPPIQQAPLTGKIAHHVPCHVKALQGGVPAPGLLQTVAHLRVETLDLSCSGMAGAYGLAAANYATSLDAGKPMLDRFKLPEFHYGSSECSSCRLQMEHIGKKPVLHPVQYLAWSMGLMPNLKDRLGC
jgi:FAD/FMN-containing dehydrogenase/Fe-S oxidoreductase